MTPAQVERRARRLRMRREGLEAGLDEVRDDLLALVPEAQAVGIPLKELAERAGITEQALHKLRNSRAAA